ncbi:MAG: sugar transferase [Candidatus Aenigmarchaeota archaeon]|nr:sugar transferase [Candidatus Aenigmarchaeota archaeon]
MKRIFDIFTSLVGLVIISPLILIASILIKMDSEGPVFFKQWRIGKDGKQFRVYKLRTMVRDADKISGQITKANDPRITRIGKLLRRYEIDELPTLINVLKGDMSIVGPRPEVPKYFKHYDNLKYREVLSVQPGITDLGTMTFRDEAKYLCGQNHEAIYEKEILPHKLDLYLEYVHNRSFLVDLKIILKTIALILKQRKR